MERTKLELMLLHLLNMRSPNGKPWKSITLPALGKFEREDVIRELRRMRAPWWKFWQH